MNATLKDYREASRKRGKRYRKRLLADGKKHVNLILSGECHRALTEEKKRSGDSFSVIVERAVFQYVNQDVKPEKVEHVTSNVNVPRGTIDTDRHEVLARIEGLKDDGLTLVEIADRLNEAGIATPSGKGEWNRNTVDNFRRRNK